MHELQPYQEPEESIGTGTWIMVLVLILLFFGIIILLSYIQ